jgi:cell division transport system ATP-binding protein
VFKLLLMVELPDKGRIRFDGVDITDFSPALRATHRRRIGVVFQDQDNRLLPKETIEENVALPLRIAGLSGRDMRQRIHPLLEQVGLADRRKELVRGLSGGEKQLVSIARALVFNPSVFFADEPTGNLDQSIAFKVMNLLKEIHRSGSTVMIATHDLSLIRSFRARTLLIKDRKIQEVRLVSPQASPGGF